MMRHLYDDILMFLSLENGPYSGDMIYIINDPRLNS